MALKEFHSPMLMTNISYGCAPFYLYFLINICGFGIGGLAMTRNLAEIGGFLLSARKIRKDIKQNGEESIYKKCWIPWDKEAI